MKILLVYPFCPDDRLETEDVNAVPMGLYFIGAMLKANGYETAILNTQVLKSAPHEIQNIIASFAPEVIGYSVLNANRWSAIDIARLAKQHNPEVINVFGGVGAGFLAENFLKHFPEIDFVVTGEGEYTFRDLLGCIEQKRDFSKISGLAFRQNGVVRKNPPAERIRNLDELPNPARYFKYQHVALTRGCPNNCTFCGSPKFWGPGVSTFSARYFVEQLQLLHQQGVNFFYVSDDTFTLKREAVLDICRMIRQQKLDINWAAISRVDLVDEELLLAMRKAGCIQISYGVESGSPQIRQAMNKRITNQQIREAFHLTAGCGILPRAYFIYGSPGETQDTIEASVDLMQEIKPLGAVFYMMDLFPGTALYEDYQQTSGKTDDIWLDRIEDIPYFETDSALSQEMVTEFGRRLRTAFHENLHRYAADVALMDRPEMAPWHADFCSRLAMTFSHGDYAQIDAIRYKDETAEKLYLRALDFHPDHRAHLGLGMLYQRQRRFSDAMDVLKKGVAEFPASREMSVCLGVTYMNLGDFRAAMNCFKKYEERPEVKEYVRICREKIRG